MSIEFAQMMMQQALVLIAQIEAKDIEQCIQESRDSISNAHSIGAILDPTAYRNAHYSGQFDHAKAQEEIAKHMLKIRQLVNDLNKAALQYASFESGQESLADKLFAKGLITQEEYDQIQEERENGS